MHHSRPRCCADEPIDTQLEALQLKSTPTTYAPRSVVACHAMPTTRATRVDTSARRRVLLTPQCRTPMTKRAHTAVLLLLHRQTEGGVREGRRFRNSRSRSISFMIRKAKAQHDSNTIRMCSSCLYSIMLHARDATTTKRESPHSPISRCEVVSPVAVLSPARRRSEGSSSHASSDRHSRIPRAASPPSG